MLLPSESDPVSKGSKISYLLSIGMMMSPSRIQGSDVAVQRLL